MPVELVDVDVQRLAGHQAQLVVVGPHEVRRIARVAPGFEDAMKLIQRVWKVVGGRSLVKAGPQRGHNGSVGRRTVRDEVREQRSHTFAPKRQVGDTATGARPSRIDPQNHRDRCL